MFYELTDHFHVSAPIEKVWAFFSQAENLPAITPSWLNFTIKTPKPITIRKDSLLDYTVKWLGLPIHWRTRIIDWTPPRSFIDLQIKGPYTLWHHHHTFTPTDTGVTCTDQVTYKLPFSLLGRATHALMVKQQLLEIFRYRRQAIEKHLGALTPRQPDVQISPLK